MHDATPTTATFLFTDIEGSTKLLRTHRPEYARILSDHHRLLREAFGAHGGREIDNQGDSFFVAFARAKDAVLAAAASQRALAAHSWPGGASVRVRMGIHTGEADLTPDRYLGLSVHRAARISALGHGGQILVSPTTAGLLEDEDALPGLALRDLGEHRLKDIERPVRLYQLDVDGLQTNFPSLAVSVPAEPSRRRRVAVAAAALAVVGATAATFAFASRDDPPPAVLPNSVIRIDPNTLEPTDVISVSAKPDFVVTAGGYVWVTHGILRDTPTTSGSNAPELALSRVDPSTGDAVVVGGGLAPCGLVDDPSGDVWVANCFVGGSEKNPNVVRVDADTLAFEAQWPLPEGEGFYRSLAYGGGSLWAADVAGGDPPAQSAITGVEPQTGRKHSIRLPSAIGALAWSEGYGNLWLANCPVGGATRIGATTDDVRRVDFALEAPCAIAVDGDDVWIGSFISPTLARLGTVGPAKPKTILLPAVNSEAGVWTVAAGAGVIWATTPRDGALWRIDPRTSEATRIPLPYLPAGVTAGSSGVWVTVRDG